MQGYILGSYFWGYIVTQVPGGRIAEMYSAKWVIWACVFLQAILSLLTPPAAYISYVAVIVVRIIEGLGAVSLNYFFMYFLNFILIFIFYFIFIYFLNLILIYFNLFFNF